MLTRPLPFCTNVGLMFAGVCALLGRSGLRSPCSRCEGLYRMRNGLSRNVPEVHQWMYRYRGGLATNYHGKDLHEPFNQLHFQMWQYV